MQKRPIWLQRLYARLGAKRANFQRKAPVEYHLQWLPVGIILRHPPPVYFHRSLLPPSPCRLRCVCLLTCALRQAANSSHSTASVIEQSVVRAALENSIGISIVSRLWVERKSPSLSQKNVQHSAQIFPGKNTPAIHRESRCRLLYQQCRNTERVQAKGAFCFQLFHISRFLIFSLLYETLDRQMYALSEIWINELSIDRYTLLGLDNI